MEVIKKEITDVLRKNTKARYRLSYEFNVHNNTVNNWIDNNDKGLFTMLTTPMGLKAISEELDIKKKDLLIEY